jgi:hypothetical protein
MRTFLCSTTHTCMNSLIPLTRLLCVWAIIRLHTSTAKEGGRKSSKETLPKSSSLLSSSASSAYDSRQRHLTLAVEIDQVIQDVQRAMRFLRTTTDRDGFLRRTVSPCKNPRIDFGEFSRDLGPSYSQLRSHLRLVIKSLLQSFLMNGLVGDNLFIIKAYWGIVEHNIRVFLN